MLKHPRLVRSTFLIFLFTISTGIATLSRAGFEAPPGLPTTIKDMPYLFLGQTDYRPPGTGIVSFVGGVANWKPDGTEAPMGGGKFQIDVTGSHSVGPDGEGVPGPQMRLSFMDVVAGGAAKGPDITSADHGSHKDWLQILLNPIEAGRSRLYVRLDHIIDGSTPPTIDPAMFVAQIPEPATWLMFALGIGFVLANVGLRRALRPIAIHRE